MNVFEVVKENVTARQAAEAYGLKEGRTGMACCPFHSDKSPSMKLDERYYCFGCGATGLQFVMQLYPPNRLIKFLYVGSRTLLHHFLHPYHYWHRLVVHYTWC